MPKPTSGSALRKSFAAFCSAHSTLSLSDNEFEVWASAMNRIMRGEMQGMTRATLSVLQKSETSKRLTAR